MILPVTPPRRALTLLEILLTAAVLSILFAILCVWIQQVQAAGNVVVCKAHLKDLALAMHSYENAVGKLPPYASGRPGEIHGGWYMHLLPYVGRKDLYYLVQRSQRSTNPKGIKIATTGEFHTEIDGAAFPELVCASDPTRSASGGDNTTNYVANWYALSDGIRGTYRRAQRLTSLNNGLSNAVLLAEAYSECRDLKRLALYSARYHNFGITQEGLPSDDPYYAPKDYLMFQDNPRSGDCDRWRTQTPHRSMPVALADGSVRGVAPTISPQTWKRVVRARGTEFPGNDW